jgi:hypothetical protein
MGMLSGFFKWIFGFFSRRRKAADDVKKDLEEERSEEEFVEERIGEIAEALVKAQNAEKIAKEAEKIEEEGQVTGKSLEEVEKEEQEMMLKLDKFEKELGAFRKQLDQILKLDEEQDEDMEQKIELAKEKAKEVVRKRGAHVSGDSDEYGIIIQEVQLESNKVENSIKRHKSTIESDNRFLDGIIIRVQDSIKEVRKNKAEGYMISSLFKGVEFSMSNLAQQLVKTEEDLEKSRKSRDKFLEDWFKVTDKELKSEKSGEKPAEDDKVVRAKPLGSEEKFVEV